MREARVDGYCVQHHHMQCVNLMRQAICARTEAERIRLKALHKVEPCNSITVATPDEERWIYSECNDAMVQVDSEGNIVVRCHCQGCLGREVEDGACAVAGHCAYCQCIDCSCEARRNLRLCKPIMTAWWDNPCLGVCDTCIEAAHRE